MERGFIAFGYNLDLLVTLGKWKILTMRELWELSNYTHTLSYLRRKINILEEHELIKSFPITERSKVYYLTDEGAKYTPFLNSSGLDPNSLNHDVTCSRVLRYFKEQGQFYNVQMFHELDLNEVDADGAVCFARDGKIYNVAIEVELTRKNQKRIKAKYSKYYRSRYDLVLYLMNKENLVKGYSRFLMEMSQGVQEKVVLMYTDGLKVSGFDPRESWCFYMGERTTYGDIFGTSERCEVVHSRCEEVLPGAPAGNCSLIPPC